MCVQTDLKINSNNSKQFQGLDEWAVDGRRPDGNGAAGCVVNLRVVLGRWVWLGLDGDPTESPSPVEKALKRPIKGVAVLRTQPSKGGGAQKVEVVHTGKK